MISWVLLILISTSTVSSAKVTISFIGTSAIIGFDVPNTSDMSAAFMECFTSEAGRNLFLLENEKMKEALVAAEFKGRVKYNYNITEARVYLELLNFTESDVGKYTCYLLDGREKPTPYSFSLNMTKAPPTPGPGPAATQGGNQPPANQDLTWISLVVVLVVLLAGLVLFLLYRCRTPRGIVFLPCSV